MDVTVLHVLIGDTPVTGEMTAWYKAWYKVQTRKEHYRRFAGDEQPSLSQTLATTSPPPPQ